MRTGTINQAGWDQCSRVRMWCVSSSSSAHCLGLWILHCWIAKSTSELKCALEMQKERDF